MLRILISAKALRLTNRTVGNSMIFCVWHIQIIMLYIFANCVLCLSLAIRYVFVVDHLSLPSDPATTGGIHRPINSYLIRNGPHRNDKSNYLSIVACVFVAAGTCLQSHCLATIGWIHSLYRLIRVIYQLRHWYGLRCHDIHTNLHKYWFSHSKFDRGETRTDTLTRRWYHKPTLTFSK
jgi:hypothetical protein